MLPTGVPKLFARSTALAEPEWKAVPDNEKARYVVLVNTISAHK